MRKVTILKSEPAAAEQGNTTHSCAVNIAVGGESKVLSPDPRFLFLRDGAMPSSSVEEGSPRACIEHRAVWVGIQIPARPPSHTGKGCRADTGHHRAIITQNLAVSKLR